MEFFRKNGKIISFHEAPIREVYVAPTEYTRFFTFREGQEIFVKSEEHPIVIEQIEILRDQLEVNGDVWIRLHASVNGVASVWKDKKVADDADVMIEYKLDF